MTEEFVEEKLEFNCRMRKSSSIIEFHITLRVEFLIVPIIYSLISFFAAWCFSFMSFSVYIATNIPIFLVLVYALFIAAISHSAYLFGPVIRNWNRVNLLTCNNRELRITFIRISRRKKKCLLDIPFSKVQCFNYYVTSRMPIIINRYGPTKPKIRHYLQIFFKDGERIKIHSSDGPTPKVKVYPRDTPTPQRMGTYLSEFTHIPLENIPHENFPTPIKKRSPTIICNLSFFIILGVFLLALGGIELAIITFVIVAIYICFFIIFKLKHRK